MRGVHRDALGCRSSSLGRKRQKFVTQRSRSHPVALYTSHTWSLDRRIWACWAVSAKLFGRTESCDQFWRQRTGALLRLVRGLGHANLSLTPLGVCSVMRPKKILTSCTRILGMEDDCLWRHALVRAPSTKFLLGGTCQLRHTNPGTRSLPEFGRANQD